MINPAFSEPDDSYYVQTKEYFLPVIPDGADTALDLGCGSGKFGQRLIALGKARTLYGVEIFAPAANEAMKAYHTVHLGDIEEMQLPYDGFFDLIICGDVLEHLKDPGKVLAAAHKWLKANGRIVCCLPNIRYWRVIYRLLVQGDWRYQSDGVMDRTHLRFFTTRSFTRLLDEAGFDVEKHDVRSPLGPKQRLFNRLTFGLFRELLGIQIMFCARKR